MTIKYETTLEDFEFWGPARENVAKLTKDELELLEAILDDGNPFGRTELNDFFAYDFATACDMLRLTEKEVLARK